jgi:hypothetical protein
MSISIGGHQPHGGEEDVSKMMNEEGGYNESKADGEQGHDEGGVEEETEV